MARINMKTILFSTLSQEAHLSINKKLLAQVGLELATFIAFLIDKSKYHEANEELTEDEYFYATDSDIFLFTGLKKTTLTKIKKLGLEKNLFFMKKEGIPQKTYYKLNYETILAFLSVDLSTLELAYNRAFNINSYTEEENKEMVDILSEDVIYKLSYRELRLLCKKLKIAYNGNDKKKDLIDKILIEQGFSQWAEKLPTSVQKNRPLVDTKSAHKCTEKSLTSGQKNCTKKNQIEKNQMEKNQIENDVDFFESLFKEINITYTKTNKASVEKLLKNMTKKEVELYLKETYEAIKETPEVKSIARLFSSKIAKGERQIISPKQKKENISTLPLTQNIVTLDDSNNNKENTIFSSMNNNTITDNTLDKFYRLSEYEQLKIEEEALKMCITKENVEENFLLNMKEISKTIYHSTLKKYIKVILEDKKLLEALETSN